LIRRFDGEHPSASKLADKRDDEEFSSGEPTPKYPPPGPTNVRMRMNTSMKNAHVFARIHTKKSFVSC
jgi:hypothetical protein